MPTDKKKSKKDKIVTPSESEEEDPVSSEEEKAKKKKKKKKVVTPSDSEDGSSDDEKAKKKKKKKIAIPSDSEEDSSEEEKAKKKKKKKKIATPSDSEADSSEEEKAKRKKKKKKIMTPSDSEADSSEDEKVKKKKKKDKKDKKQKKEPIPVAGVILEAKPVPKKDNLKILTVGLGTAFAVTSVEIVTNAPNITKGKKYVCALPGVKVMIGGELTKVEARKVGGFESCGMLCGPQELDWATDILPGPHAVLLPDDAEPGQSIPSYDECVKAYKVANPPKEEKPAGGVAKKDDKKKKKKAAKAADEDDFLAALADVADGPVDQVKDEPVAKAKAKAKAKSVPAPEVVQEKPMEAPVELVPEPEKPEKEEPTKEHTQPEFAQQEPMDEELDAKTLANRRKKEKKKMADQAKAASSGGGMWGGGEDGKVDVEGKVDVVEKSEDSKMDKKGPKGNDKTKGKPMNAALAEKVRQAEELRQLQEEKAQFEKAEKERIESEKAQFEEELRLKKEQQQERIRKRLEKKAQAIADGTWKDKKQKLQEERAKLLREQFGFDINAQDDEGDEEAPKSKTKATPATKLKKRAPRGTTGDEVARPVEAQTKDVEEDDGDNWEAGADDGEEIPKDAKNGTDHSDDKNAENSSDDDDDDDDFLGYRSPIVCIMGHVDTGKTKLLDKIRRTNVQEGEAGGITQQIGATFFPDIALNEQTTKVDDDFEIEVPGLMIIDTPGHESFNNLRTRGSSLCDIAILVIDIMHGLEPQTVESLEMLKKRKCPFIIAMNKVDRLHGWNSDHYTGIQSSFERQEESVHAEFRKRFDGICLQLAERGLNCYLYWENEDISKYVSIIPTSAMTGEGVPDLLFMILNYCQTIIPEAIEVVEDLECTVIEVKNIEGLGTTIDVVLKNGTIRVGDQIVIGGVGGPIVTTIRELVTPQPMKEMRVKTEYIHHKMINTSMGVKICAPELENAVAGSELYVVGPDDDLEELKEEIEDSMEGGVTDFEKVNEGVYVKASTLGSLEALLAFLTDMKIPVFNWGIGEVHKMDVKRASLMKEKKRPELALILAFDVKVNREAQALADKDEVPIFTADIIYHLFDRFTKHMDVIKEKKKTEAKDDAVFPVMLEIDGKCIFRRQNPLILGCAVKEGQLRVGTPICIPEKDFMEIGRVASIERDKKPVQMAKKGQQVCVKIEQATSQQHIAYGRHFDHTNQLFSKITRSSIDSLKDLFRDDMKKDDWALLISMKKMFQIS